MNQEELGEIIAIMLDVMPRDMNNKEIAIVMVNFFIQQEKANQWPVINAHIENGLINYLVSQVTDEGIQGEIVKNAVQDADDFLGRIINDV